MSELKTPSAYPQPPLMAECFHLLRQVLVNEGGERRKVGGAQGWDTGL